MKQKPHLTIYLTPKSMARLERLKRVMDLPSSSKVFRAALLALEKSPKATRERLVESDD